MKRSQEWWDRFYLGLAKYYASASKDPSTQTGAVITRGKYPVAFGYNGFPQDIHDNERLNDREKKYELIIHCEMNAIMSTTKALELCTLYTWPFMSCHRCAVHMIQAGITRFVAPVNNNPRWVESFEKTQAVLREAGREIVLYEVEGIES